MRVNFAHSVTKFCLHYTWSFHSMKAEQVPGKKIFPWRYFNVFSFYFHKKSQNYAHGSSTYVETSTVWKWNLQPNFHQSLHFIPWKLPCREIYFFGRTWKITLLLVVGGSWSLHQLKRSQPHFLVEAATNLYNSPPAHITSTRFHRLRCSRGTTCICGGKF